MFAQLISGRPRRSPGLAAMGTAGLGLAVALTLTACSSGSSQHQAAADAASSLRSALAQASVSASSAAGAATSASVSTPATSADTTTSTDDDPSASTLPSLTGSDFCVSLSKAAALVASQADAATGSATSSGAPDLSSIFTTEKQALTPLLGKAPAELKPPLQDLLSVVDSLADLGASVTDPASVAKLEQKSTQLEADSTQIEAYISTHCTAAK